MMQAVGEAFVCGWTICFLRFSLGTGLEKMVCRLGYFASLLGAGVAHGTLQYYTAEAGTNMVAHEGEAVNAEGADRDSLDRFGLLLSEGMWWPRIQIELHFASNSVVVN